MERMTEEAVELSVVNGTLDTYEMAALVALLAATRDSSAPGGARPLAGTAAPRRAAWAAQRLHGADRWQRP